MAFYVIMINTGVLFIGSIVLGIIVIIFGKYSLRYSLEETKGASKLRYSAIILIALAFMIHTSGDYYGGLYSNEDLGHGLESFAHVMLFVAFSIYSISAKRILETARGFWLK